MTGRFAPTPSSDLHLGNLRTALVAWLMARREGGAFLVRVEDLDVARVAAAPGVATRQLSDLASLGLTWDGDVVWQSRRLGAYERALAALADLTYECFCTRRDIAEAAVAPHGDGYRPYPGTCRDLTAAERDERRRVRPPALRVRAGDAVQTIRDLWAGAVTGVVDDFVVRRNDGVPSYNLAVVVDDIAAGVDQVVRGDDLLSSSPRQAWLIERLGGSVPRYAHVPLAVGRDGKRLAKREGDLTLADLGARGWPPVRVLRVLAESLGLDTSGVEEPRDLLGRFDPAAMPREPWVVPDYWPDVA